MRLLEKRGALPAQGPEDAQQALQLLHLGPRPGPRQAQLQADDCIQGRIARDLAGSDDIAATPTPSLGTGLILDPWKSAALTVLVRAPGQRCELWRDPAHGAGDSIIAGDCIQGRIARDLAGSEEIAAAPTPRLGTGLTVDPWKSAALTILVRAPGQRCELWRDPVLGAGRSTILPSCDIGLLIHGVFDPSAPSRQHRHDQQRGACCLDCQVHFLALLIEYGGPEKPPSIQMSHRRGK
ncbi:hypothetical protein CYFUS_002528 [Cystobacter fuscus]|uniref:Uncharacterized protein n=1 Tax=Cystobacter fuscus TaxID=43 RepID=A0A250J0X6_9BACT|nr:hypothetical protein CYFUS_002528 [Cystobacter fuscus]